MRISDDSFAFTRHGATFLQIVMVSLLAAVLVLSTVSPLLPILVAVAVAAVPVLVALFRREDLNLFVVLWAFVLIMGYESGIQLSEVVYGLYFSGFLFVWYLRRVYFEQRPLITSAEDAAVLVIGIYVVASVSWSVLFGAELSAVLGELLVLAMLGFYFPAKQACLDNPDRAARRFILLFVWFALFVFTRNLITYWQGLYSAEHLFEIIRGRVALNEILVTMPALGSLVFIITVRQWQKRAAALLLFSICLAGLIITQSRGYWIAFAFGVLALIVLAERSRGLRLIGIGSVTLGLVVGLTALLLPRLFELIVLGVVDRVAGIATAFTTDISMVNRLLETSAVWDKIKLNPILGYGTGAKYQYWNLTFLHTIDYAFVHNAFAGLWFKYGLMGLCLMIFVWVRSIWSGIELYRSRRTNTLTQIIGLSIAVCLIAEFPVANTSNPFLTADGVLFFAIFCGVASGLRQIYLRPGAA